jgi:hypothetical protein
MAPRARPRVLVEALRRATHRLLARNGTRSATRALKQPAISLTAAAMGLPMIIKDGTVCWAEIKIEGDR